MLAADGDGGGAAPGPRACSPIAVLLLRPAPPPPPSPLRLLPCLLHVLSRRAALVWQVELFSVDSNDESNVALFHPHPTACAQLGFLYATKDGRIRAFRFDRCASPESVMAE